MRVEKNFGVRAGVTAAGAAVALFVFGAGPVRAQTAPAGRVAPSAAVVSIPPQPQEPVRRLSINEAVALALEQNIDLQVDRIDPQLQDLSVAVARSGWTPAFFSNLQTRSQSNPTTDIFGGAASLTNDNLTSQAGVQQLLPWGGGNYTAFFNSGRSETSNIFSTFNPQLSSSLGFNYTQPLLRNFTIDATRQQVLVSRKNREISDVQLNQSIAATTRNVKNAYWDLVFAINNLAVQRQSLQLAQQSFRDNRARVEIGTMAPLDIVQAEAEVAQREESVILAEAAIQAREDALRALISNPADQPEFWNTRLEPADLPNFEPIAVDVEAAVRTALANRTDLATTRKQLEANDISIRYFRNQSLPDVNALVNYSAFGLAGTRLELTPGLNPTIISQSPRGFGGALGDIFGSDYPSWSMQLQVNYPIGASSAEGNLARARLQDSQARKRLQGTELQVTTQIRSFARNVTTNAKRVEATRASRALAQKRLEAEEKKFTAGMTSSFLVIQAQRDLSNARNNELQAIIDYLKSVVDFETSQQAPLGGGGGGLVQTGQQQQSQQQNQQQNQQQQQQ
ncbi:MAG: TolC family protein [Acidobacteria bacterium]|nr:TolC family protein [Acidobacteriota bacterium]